MEYIKSILKRVKINCSDLHLISFSWTPGPAILRVQGEWGGALWKYSWLPTDIGKGEMIQKIFPVKYFPSSRYNLLLNKNYCF